MHFCASSTLQIALNLPSEKQGRRGYKGLSSSRLEPYRINANDVEHGVIASRSILLPVDVAGTADR